MNERFSWSRVDKVTACYELKRRNVLRTLHKDSDLNCLSCGRKPKRADDCYYPAPAVSSTNVIIGHKDCVDRTCAEHTAKSAGEAAAKANRVKNVIPMVNATVSAASVDVSDDPLALAQLIWNEAYEAGVAAGRAQMRDEFLAGLAKLHEQKRA